MTSPLIRRFINRSIRDHVAGLFADPPPATGWAPFAIYTEANLRTAGFTEVAPFLYLITSEIERAELRLPLVALLVESTDSHEELGNPFRDKHYVIQVDCLGRSQGEAEDLADMISTFSLTIPVYDYSQDEPYPVISYGETEDEIRVTREPMPRDLVLEGTIVHVQRVTWAAVFKVPVAG